MNGLSSLRESHFHIHHLIVTWLKQLGRTVYSKNSSLKGIEPSYESIVESDHHLMLRVWRERAPMSDDDCLFLEVPQNKHPGVLCNPTIV